MAFADDLERAVTASTSAASRRLLLRRVGALAIAAPIGLFVLQACGGEAATPTAVPAVATEAPAEVEADETEAAEVEETVEAVATEEADEATPAAAASPVAAGASPVTMASPVSGASPVADASPVGAATPMADDATPTS